MPVSIGDGTVQVGWRLSAHDDPELGFDVFRRAGADPWVKCNEAPVTTTTDFVDTPPGDPGAFSWFVQPVVGDTAGPESNVAQLAPGHSNPPYLTTPMDGDDQVNRAAVADLDGDGKLDWVIEQPRVTIDPVEGWTPSTDTYKLEAYSNDGTYLWRLDRGWSIETGIWYAPYLVHELNGDGAAEVILKTGEGDPRDADGKVTPGSDSADPVNGLMALARNHAHGPKGEHASDGRLQAANACRWRSLPQCRAWQPEAPRRRLASDAAERYSPRHAGHERARRDPTPHRRMRRP